jgi:thiamine-phosphate pyrophosphorylase
MRRRQTVPHQWLIVPGSLDPKVFVRARRLPRGSGILLLQAPSATDLRRLRQLARQHILLVVVERRRTAARVHDVRELRRALLARIPLILLSPLHPTASHPEWTPLPRMRAAALARLGRRGLVALGGMDAKRYAAVAPLGFTGWAGISAFRT